MSFKFYIQTYGLFLLCLLQLSYADNCYNFTNHGCEIKCSGSYNESWKEEIKKITISKDCKTIAKLDIVDANDFPKNILPANWLHGMNLHIQTLEFRNCEFERIEPGALDNNRIKTLIISKCNMNYFTKDFLQCVTTLESFTISGYLHGEISVEAKIFENIPSLTTLSIDDSRLNGQVIDNITGEAGSNTKLQLIIVQRGELKHLPRRMISKAKDIRGLFLIQNGMKTIDKEAFWPHNIQTIDLTGNALITLKEDTFKYIASDIYMNRTIKLTKNNWNCDCHLKWLYDLSFKYKKFHLDPEPECDDGVKFSEGSFECPGVSSTTSIATTTPAEATTTPADTTITPEYTTTEISTTTDPNENKDYITLECQDGRSQDTSNYQLDSREYLMTVEMKIAVSQEKLIRMNIYNLDEYPKIEIEFEGNLTDLTLLYVDVFNSSAPACLKNMPNSVFLCDIVRNRTYTMCLVSEGETKVPPSSCFGFKVPPDWQERAWIVNKSKYLTIGLIAGSLLLSGIVSGIIMFFIIRFNPSLIDGNEDVIIVKRKSESQTEPQSNFERPEYSEPFVMTGQSGYMTPTLPQYEKINYYARQMGSIYGNNSTSYIRPGYVRVKSKNHLKCVNEVESTDIYNASAPSIPRLPYQKERTHY